MSHMEMEAMLSKGRRIPLLESKEGLYLSFGDLILEHLQYHPSLQNVESLTNQKDVSALNDILQGSDLDNHFVTSLVEYIAKQAQQAAPQQPVRLVLNELDSGAMQGLVGGDVEISEFNPFMGARGVSRFSTALYKPAFALECAVIKALQAQSITIEIIVPFVRCLSDAAQVIDLLAEQGLPRGLNGLKVLYRCDTPSSVLIADRLLQYFDGLAIDVENLAQFTLGLDKSNQALVHLFDAQHDSVLELLSFAFKAAQTVSKPVLLAETEYKASVKLQQLATEFTGIELL